MSNYLKVTWYTLRPAKYATAVIQCLNLTNICPFSFHFQSSNTERLRSSLPQTLPPEVSVSIPPEHSCTLNLFHTKKKKKVHLLSLTLLLLSEFLPWPEGAVCMAGPWHDKPRSPQGEGGFLEVSWLARHGSPSRADIQRWPGRKCSITRRPA